MPLRASTRRTRDGLGGSPPVARSRERRKEMIGRRGDPPRPERERPASARRRVIVACRDSVMPRRQVQLPPPGRRQLTSSLTKVPGRRDLQRARDGVVIGQRHQMHSPPWVSPYNASIEYDCRSTGPAGRSAGPATRMEMQIAAHQPRTFIAISCSSGVSLQRRLEPVHVAELCARRNGSVTARRRTPVTARHLASPALPTMTRWKRWTSRRSSCSSSTRAARRAAANALARRRAGRAAPGASASSACKRSSPSISGGGSRAVP